VVEVAGLPEHLLDECDQKASFVSCDVTGKSGVRLDPRLRVAARIVVRIISICYAL
jgi:hypothetical protein